MCAIAGIVSPLQASIPGMHERHSAGRQEILAISDLPTAASRGDASVSDAWITTARRWPRRAVQDCSRQAKGEARGDLRYVRKMLLWKWRARRAVKPIIDEHKAASEKVNRGPDDWVQWWRATGERELRCILMAAWDPVGVGDAPEAWDEYDDYAPGVAHRLRDATDSDEAIEQVAEHLNHIERDFMDGLTEERRRANVYLAASLVAWHEWSFRRDGRPPHEWIDED
jgi:hypothetical protein